LATLRSVNRKKPIKKLVYTARVKRLIFTSVSLVILILVAGTIFNSIKITALAYAFSPLVLLLANIINTPIEKLIRLKYILDAKKIIKNHPNLTVIGITGSFGKTTTKNFLYTLLSADFSVLMTPKNYNTTMGVVKTIREQLSARHNIFLCEMGAKWKGDINEICEIVKPKIGILTGIAPIHLETFKSMNVLIETKKELTKYVKRVYFNGDNEYLRDNIKQGVSYGINQNNDVFARDISLSEHGTTFTIQNNIYKTSLIGSANVENLTGAIAVASDILHSKNITQLVSKIKPIEHRQELKIIDSNNLLIDDAYNSNPVGAKVALETLSLFKSDYKMLITPGMIDLGKKQEQENYKFGLHASKVCDRVLLIRPKWAKPIENALIKNNFTNYQYFDNVSDALKFAFLYNTPKHKVILVENDLPDNYW
jgi:UDP-N-acetylmuramoyl-tripeptide--D-alanyl-D-alanine ligase